MKALITTVPFAEKNKLPFELLEAAGIEYLINPLNKKLTEDELTAAGVTPGYVRLCIGLEHIDDIIDDLDQALDKSSKGNLKAVS